MRHSTPPTALLAALALLAACGTETPTDVDPQLSAHDAPAATVSSPHLQYGRPLKLGQGRARAYALVTGGVDHHPIEIGVALDEQALAGLGSEPQVLLLDPPPLAPEPYRFMMLDWNPQGHQPPGVYTVPHFDFHFYMVPESDVEAITPADPLFAAKADNLPGPDYRPPFYVVLTAPGEPPSSVAVPEMGVHWIDIRSPEIQGLIGNPGGYQPFTKTFIYGSWDGRVTFLEPMITVERLQAKGDETIPIPQPALYPDAGWFPAAYRISYDEHAREYRVALTDLSWRD